MKKIRVLVVDDSAFLRRNLPRILETDSDIQVVDTASNGAEAVEKAKALRPDVITLDVVMPVMDGLTALKHIMREVPTPVIMVSSATREGAPETLEALSLGAIDFIQKPSGPISLDIDKVSSELHQKVRTAYSGKIKMAVNVDVTRDKFRAIVDELSQGRPEPVSTLPAGERAASGAPKRLVAIACSTGGPAALQWLIPRLPKDIKAGVVIVQHIASGFTRPLAERLNSLSALTVREAEPDLPVAPGVVLIAPADQHLTLARDASRNLIVKLSPEPSNTLHRPAADVLFRSVAEVCAAETCAVILTGMGEDGALGIKSIRDHGGYTIAQDEATALIYGMPRRAVELGGVITSLPLNQIAAEIARVTA